MPCHRWRTGVARKTLVGAGHRGNAPVRLVTGRTIEIVWSQQLVWARDLLQLLRFGVALVTGSRLINRHRASGLGVRRMAVSTSNARQIMLRTVPLVHMRPVVTLQAQILARRGQHVPVWVVTSCTVEVAVMTARDGCRPLSRFPDG